MYTRAKKEPAVTPSIAPAAMKGRLSSRAWAAEEAIVPNTGLPAHTALPPPQSADGSPRPRTSLPSASITGDGGGRHVPQTLVQAPVGRHHTAEEDRRGHHHGPEAAGNAHKAGIHKRRAQHDQRPDRAGDENTLRATRYITCTSRYRRSDTLADTMRDHRDGKTGNGNGIYRQINIVSGGKIAEPGDARDFLPLDGNFEQGAMILVSTAARDRMMAPCWKLCRLFFAKRFSPSRLRSVRQPPPARASARRKRLPPPRRFP